MKKLRLPEPGERWRSPNGTEFLIGEILGNCCMLEGIGHFNRRMIAFTCTPIEGVSESVADEAGAP